MDAQTFEDLNTVIAKLANVISTARYGDDREGMITIAVMPELLADIADAVATINDLTAPRDPRPEEGVVLQALTHRVGGWAWKREQSWEDATLDDSQYQD